ncbi:MAG: Crp/Fnr family transcriptional regulator [Rectinemataceae bacterium]
MIPDPDWLRFLLLTMSFADATVMPAVQGRLCRVAAFPCPGYGGYMVDIESLQKYSLFGGLLPEQIVAIRQYLVFESYPAGTDIETEGRDNDRIHFILEGRVAVIKGTTTIVEIGEGETFGEMEILDVMPATATIRALCPVRVATLSNRALHHLSHEDIRAFAITVMNLARDLSRRLRRMNELAVGNSQPDCP